MKSFVSLQNRTKASRKYTTTTTKIVHEYDEKHPLISIEERSKANPDKPFRSLVLTSPYEHIIIDENDDSTKKGKRLQISKGDNTFVDVRITDPIIEMGEQRQQNLELYENLTVSKTIDVLQSMGISLYGEDDSDDEGNDNEEQEH
jgi:hypothetical protein